LNIIAWIITVLVMAMVGGMQHIKLDSSIDFTFLPPLYSFLNGLTAILLIAALFFIKSKQVQKHRITMTLAAFFSLIFLVGYVLYHITTPETRFGGTGTIRFFYLLLLISHVILAAIIFPFILFTYIRAFTRQFEKHKKMARWVFWVWLYVAVTGPILYFMIKPYYNH
jgi:putative membrane protein